MSTTLSKRSLAEALIDAHQFRQAFEGCYKEWMIAGSVRRKKQWVGDIEHVVIPAFGDVPINDGRLFPATENVNLLWHRAEQMLADGIIIKHEYPGRNTGVSSHRWGDKYRGCDFRGFNNEIFCADVDNLGSVLAIRTGPADFSKRMVTALHDQGLRNAEGYVYECQQCDWCDIHNRRADCNKCKNTRLIPVTRLAVPTEQAFFELARVGWIEPESRT